MNAWPAEHVQTVPHALARHVAAGDAVQRLMDERDEPAGGVLSPCPIAGGVRSRPRSGPTSVMLGSASRRDWGLARGLLPKATNPTLT